LIKLFSDLHCVDTFQRYSRSNSKVVKNRADFWKFFSPSHILGGGRPKVTPILSPLPRGTSPAKSYVRILPLSPKLYGLTHSIYSQILNFLDYIFGGTPVPVVVWASKAWSICNTCKNLRGQHPQGTKCSLPKMSAWLGGRVNMSPYNFFVCGPKFTYFSPNVERIVVDKMLFLFAICWSIPEIFANKVESCQKSSRILKVLFALPNFRGPAFQSYTHFITLPHGTSPGKKFCEETPTIAPKL